MVTSQEAHKIHSFINIYNPHDKEPRDKEFVSKKRNRETEYEKVCENKKKKIKTDNKKKKIIVKAKKQMVRKLDLTVQNVTKG